MSVLELSNVTKRFGSFVAVKDVSFSVGKGEVLSLLGPSGCGKTTTLRLISGFEEPNEGNILFSGKEMKRKRPYERNVGLLFQDYALFPHMTVEQNIAYGMTRRGFDKAQIVSRSHEMLELVKLSGFGKRRPGQLSGGQQQRVALARSLATNPEIVLLDEPLSALDAKLRQELRFELKEILSTVNATTIVVTHDQEEAMSLGDNVIVMSEGQIMQAGPPTEIYAKPQTKFIAEFIGRSNWFGGTIRPSIATGVREFSTQEGIQIQVPEPDMQVSTDKGYEVCVRPERIEISTTVPVQTGTPFNALPGTVVDVAHLGSDIHLVVQIAENKLITVTEQYCGQQLEQTGQEVFLTFPPEACIVVPAGS